MKGKSAFTSEEATKIKSMLDECIRLGRYENITLRNSLRVKYGFYTGNFSNSPKLFSSADFDHHVSIGNITVETEEKDPLLTILETIAENNYQPKQLRNKLKELTIQAENHEFQSIEHENLFYALLRVVENRGTDIFGKSS